jgi:hypothetical protein
MIISASEANVASLRRSLRNERSVYRYGRAVLTVSQCCKMSPPLCGHVRTLMLAVLYVLETETLYSCTPASGAKLAAAECKILFVLMHSVLLQMFPGQFMVSSPSIASKIVIIFAGLTVAEEYVSLPDHCEYR